MKRNLIVVAALAFLTFPAISFATPPKPGPYVSGFLGVNFLQNTTVTGTDTFSNSINDRVEFDPGISIGGTGGFDFGFFRLEGELSYKHGEISQVRDTLPGGTTFGNTHGSIGALAVMANGFFDMHNASPITPYFGGGIGFAALHLNDTSGIPRGGGPRTALYFSDDDTVFAYQAGGGLEIALNRRLSLDLGYRYFATDVAKFQGNGVQDLSMKLQSHNGTVGVRFKF